MEYKKFSELKQGDTIYFLIDRYNILQTRGNDGVGFANDYYGLVICSRKFSTDEWSWHNPRTDKGHLTDIYIDEEISSVNWEKEKEVIWDKNSYHSITKEEGEKSCLRFTYSYGGYYYEPKFGYIFTTKEELEERIKEVTDAVEENLRRIKEDLSKI